LAISEALLRSVGLVALLTVALGASTFVVGGLTSRLADLQLRGDPGVASTIVHDARRRNRARLQLWFDYAFILFYWLTFLGLAVVLARRGDSVAYDVAALAAAFAATVTALLDVLENVRTGALLKLSRPGDQIRLQPVKHLRRTALAKWLASAVTIALLALVFLPGDRALLLLGLGFLAAAALGAAGVAWRYLLVAYGVAFVALGVAVGVWFTFFAADLVDRL
jgi:hypothetical protein